MRKIDRVQNKVMKSLKGCGLSPQDTLIVLQSISYSIASEQFKGATIKPLGIVMSSILAVAEVRERERAQGIFSEERGTYDASEGWEDPNQSEMDSELEKWR